MPDKTLSRGGSGPLAEDRSAGASVKWLCKSVGGDFLRRIRRWLLLVLRDSRRPARGSAGEHVWLHAAPDSGGGGAREASV